MISEKIDSVNWYNSGVRAGKKPKLATTTLEHSIYSGCKCTCSLAKLHATSTGKKCLQYQKLWWPTDSSKLDTRFSKLHQELPAESLLRHHQTNREIQATFQRLLQYGLQNGYATNFFFAKVFPPITDLISSASSVSCSSNASANKRCSFECCRRMFFARSYESWKVNQLSIQETAFSLQMIQIGSCHVYITLGFSASFQTCKYTWEIFSAVLFTVQTLDQR